MVFKKNLTLFLIGAELNIVGFTFISFLIVDSLIRTKTQVLLPQWGIYTWKLKIAKTCKGKACALLTNPFWTTLVLYGFCLTEYDEEEDLSPIVLPLPFLIFYHPACPCNSSSHFLTHPWQNNSSAALSSASSYKEQWTLPTTLLDFLPLSLALKHITSVVWNGSYHCHNCTSHCESSSEIPQTVLPHTKPSNEEGNRERNKGWRNETMQNKMGIKKNDDEGR